MLELFYQSTRNFVAPLPLDFQCNPTVPSVLDPVDPIPLERTGQRHPVRAAHGRALRLALSHALATPLPRRSREVAAGARHRPHSVQPVGARREAREDAVAVDVHVPSRALRPGAAARARWPDSA